MIYNIDDILEGDLIAVICKHFGENPIYGIVENVDEEYIMIMFNYKLGDSVRKMGIFLHEIVRIQRLDEEFGEDIKNVLAAI